MPSGGSKRSLQVSELQSVPEEADEEVQIGPAPAGNAFTGKNNTSVATEVSAGLTTKSEQSEMVPGGTASQDIGGAGAFQSEDVQQQQAGNNPNPRVSSDSSEMRYRSPSRQSTGGASEGGSTASLLKEVGE